MLVKNRCGMWEMKKKTFGMRDFPTLERVEGAIQHSGINGHGIRKFTASLRHHAVVFGQSCHHAQSFYEITPSCPVFSQSRHHAQSSSQSRYHARLFLWSSSYAFFSSVTPLRPFFCNQANHAFTPCPGGPPIIY